MKFTAKYFFGEDLSKHGWKIDVMQAAESEFYHLILEHTKPADVRFAVTGPPTVQFFGNGWFASFVHWLIGSRWGRKLLPLDLQSWYRSYYERSDSVTLEMPEDTAACIDAQLVMCEKACSKVHGIVVSCESMRLLARSDQFVSTCSTLQNGYRGHDVHIVGWLRGKLAIVF